MMLNLFKPIRNELIDTLMNALLPLSFLAAAVLLLNPAPGLGADPEPNSIGMDMVRLDGGKFIRGMSGGERKIALAFPHSTSAQFFGNPESPAHWTWITKPFEIATTEVTVGQFRAFVEVTGYKTTAENAAKESLGIVGWAPTDPELPLYQSRDFERGPDVTWRAPGFKQNDDHPVTGVTLADARAFAAWLSKKEGRTYRLPTETEWEFACRAGTETFFSFGDAARGVIHKHANIADSELEKERRLAATRNWLNDWDKLPGDGAAFTAAVGSYPANAFGLHDMHGNVWEWCEDLWLDTVYTEFKRPKYDKPNGIALDPVNRDRPQTEANDFHVIRGGAWCAGPIVCRSSMRSFWDADDAACYIGFRLARDVADPHNAPARAVYEREQKARQVVTAIGGQLDSRDGLQLEAIFKGGAFQERGLAALAHLPELRRVQLHPKGGTAEQPKITSKGLQWLASLPQLEELTIGSGMEPSTMDLSLIARMPALKKLVLGRSVAVNDTHMTQLAGLRSLEAFEVWGTNGGLTDAGLQQLAGNKNLRVLSVHEVDASGAFLAAFADCPLEEFRTSRRHNGEATWTDAGVTHLAAFPELNRLSLSRQTKLSRASLSVIARLPRLRELDLRGVSAPADADFAALGVLAELDKLQLAETQAGDAALASLQNIPRLRDLSLGPNEHLSGRSLQSLGQLVSLETLNLNGSRITDADLAPLALINRLKRVQLGLPSITGSGLSALVKLPELKELTLRCPGLTNAVFDPLARSKTLRKVRLAERGVQPPAALNNDGLAQLANSSLAELWLPRNDTAMTEAFMKELQAKNPKLNIIPYTVNWK